MSTIFLVCVIVAVRQLLTGVDFYNSIFSLPVAERVRELPRGNGLLREDRQSD